MIFALKHNEPNNQMSFENVQVSAITAAVSAIASSIITAIFTRQKAKREILSIDLDNISKAVNIWKTIADELQKEILELRTQVTNLNEQVDMLRRENKNLKFKQ